MVERIKWLSATLVLLVVFCNVARAQTTVVDSMQWGGAWHRFRVYIPAQKKCALVVHLHGYGSNSFLEMIYTGFLPVADTAGFVAAFPDGLVDPIGNQSWNVGWSLQVNNDDVGYLSAFIDTMLNRYQLDPSAVFVSGLSNGGFMAFRLACELNGKIAAIANVSASMTPTLYSACTPTQPFPVLMIHGTLDTTIPYEGSTGVAASMHVDSVVKKFAALYGCDATPQETDLPHDASTVNGTSVERYDYTGCTQNTSVVLFKIINGEHVNWPGFDASTTNDFSAAQEIWKFFRSYRSCSMSGVTATTPFAPEVFPNPSDGLFHLSLHQVVSNARYAVVTNDGREALSGWIGTNDPFTIDASKLSPGCYTVRITDGNETRVCKLLIY